MATNGTITGTVTNKATTFSFYVEWTATPNSATNTSTVVVKSYWKTTNTGATWDTTSARSNYVNLIVGGVTQADSWSQRWNLNPWPSNPYLARTSTFTVQHGSDGRPPTVAIDARLDGNAGTYGPTTSTAKGSIDSYMESTTSACGAPTACSISATLAEGNVTLTWSGAAGGTNNSISSYEIQYSDSVDNVTWWAWTALATVTTSATSGSYVVTASGERGAYRRFQVRTRGTAGASFYSGWKVSTNTVRKNTLPTAPTVFNATPDIYETPSAALTWSGAKAGTSAIKQYVIQKSTSTNGSSWTAYELLATVVTAAAYGNYTTAPSNVAGTFTRYRISVTDALGAISDYTVSNIIKRNSPPIAPTVNAPTAGAATYCPTPRILIKTNTEPEGQLQKVAVKLGAGVWQDSVAVPAQYSRSGWLDSDVTTIYRAPPQQPGSMTVTVRCTDSEFGAASAEVSRVITILSSPFESIDGSETKVKAAHIATLRLVANVVRGYYGLAPVAWAEPIVAGKTPIARWPFHIAELRRAIDPVIVYINNFDSTTAFDVPWPEWLPLGCDRPRADVMRQMQDLLLSL